MSQTRLGRQSEQKTMQAQKLLDKLKEKREKKKREQNMGEVHQNSPDLLALNSIKCVSSGELSDSFRTCKNVDSSLSDLYFKIFNEHMEDAGKGANEIENILLNMRKQLQKTSEQLAFNKQYLKSNLEKSENEKVLIQQSNAKLSEEISKLKHRHEEQLQKYQELLDKKLDIMNTSGMNTSLLCDGYEEKIKQLAEKLETKESQLEQVWEKNRESQNIMTQIQSKSKKLERENEEIERQKEVLMQMVQKLTEQIQKKQEDDQTKRSSADKNSQLLRQKGKEFDIERKKFQKNIYDLKEEIESIKTKSGEKGKEDQIEISKLKSESAAKSEQVKALVEKIQKLSSNEKQLLTEIEKLKAEKGRLSYALEESIQNHKSLQSQLSMKESRFSQLSETQDDKLFMLESKVHELTRSLQEKTKALEEQNQSTSKLTQKISSLTTELETTSAAHKRTLSQLSSKQSQLLQLSQITQELTEELSNANTQLDEYQNRINIMKQENVELIHERQNAKVHIQQLQNEAKKLDQAKQERDLLDKRVEELEELLHARDVIIGKNKDQNQEAMRVMREQVERITDQCTSKAKLIKQLQSRTCDVPLSDSCPVEETQQMKDSLKRLQETEQKLRIACQERSKDSFKYIRTIEELTHQLNNAYGKVNQLTRSAAQRESDEGNQKRDSQRGSGEKKEGKGTSKGKDRPRSVNKLKSMFGFGNDSQ